MSSQFLTDLSLRVTRWRNPTSHPVRLRLYVHPGPQGTKEATIPPGETVSLPAEFDSAIQTVKDGVIVGGHAPLLVKEGQETLPVHDAIVQAAQMGILERDGGRHGAALSAEALLALAKAKKEHEAQAAEIARLRGAAREEDPEKEALRRELAEMKARLDAATAEKSEPKTGAKKGGPAGDAKPADPPKQPLPPT